MLCSVFLLIRYSHVLCDAVPVGKDESRARPSLPTAYPLPDRSRGNLPTVNREKHLALLPFQPNKLTSERARTAHSAYSCAGSAPSIQSLSSLIFGSSSFTPYAIPRLFADGQRAQQALGRTGEAHRGASRGRGSICDTLASSIAAVGGAA